MKEIKIMELRSKECAKKQPFNKERETMIKPTLYVPLMGHIWDNLKLSEGAFDVKDQPSLGDGFLPAFNSFEEAEKYYPEAEIIPIYFNGSFKHKG